MKKVLSLVLVLTLVLGSFGLTFAAPSDVVGTEYEEAVTRLGQLKVLEGYPDGTFKPENTITRAEFAAVVVRARGLESAAKASVGGTTFTDVPAGNWAAGYVNIASKSGLVNGMGDGSFAPNSPVTYEQAVTMVMRALGYEQAAQERGGYPYGYLIMASETGLLDSVKGVQGAPAPRGLVAQLVDNALEIPKMIQVGYGTQTKWVVSGTEDTKEQYLLDDLGFDNIDGRVVKVDASRKKITVKNDDVTKTLEVKEGFDFEEAEGLRIKAWYTSKNEVELSKILDTPKFDAVKPADKKVKLVGEDKNYSLAKNATLIVNNDEVEQKDFKADYAKVAFDKDGDIVWAKGYTFDGNIVVEEVDKYVVESFGYDELDLEKYTIVKDGKTITVDDLEKADVVFYNEDEKVAVVANIVKEGEIERVYIDSFKLDGKVYNIGEAKYLDGSKLGKLTYEILTQMKDNEDEVTVYFDFAGGSDGVVLVAGARKVEETTSYFLVTKTTDDFTKRNSTYWTLDVLNSEGKTVAYDVTDEFVTKFNKEAKSGEKWADVVVAGDIIEIKLDKDGDVESVSKLEKLGRYTDKFKVTADYVKGWKLQPSTVVFRNDNASSLAKHSVTTLEKAEEKFGNILKYDLYIGSKGRVVAIYADETDAKSDTTEYVGLVTDIKYLTGSSKKADVTIYIKGEKHVYTTTKKLLDDNNVKEDDIIKVSVGNKTKEIEKIDNKVTKVSATVEKVDIGARAIIAKDKAEYVLRDGGVIYDAGDGYSKLNLRDLKKGDKITLYFQEGTKHANYVVKDESGKVNPEKESNFGGAYTVKGQVWVTIDGKDYLYGGDETATKLNNLYTNKVVKVTTKTVDGYEVVTKIEIVKDEEPKDPTDPEEPKDPKVLEGEYMVSPFGGIKMIRFDMPAGQTKITSATVNGSDAEIFNVDAGKGQVKVDAKTDVVKVVIGGVEYKIEVK